MGHYWVTINIIHKRRKRVSKRKALRPSLFQYKSSYFVPETKDGLPDYRQELTDFQELLQRSAPFSFCFE